MSADTITNFITPTKDYMNWVQAQVVALSQFSASTVTIFEGQNEELLFNWIGKATLNQAIIQYNGSRYNSNGRAPRRMADFSVWVVHRNTVNRETGQDTTFDLVDAVIGALDHEIYNGHTVTHVVSDDFIDFPHAALCVYRIEFVGEDY